MTSDANVALGKIVAIHYTLKDDAGEVLDASTGQPPLEYLHGFGNIVPGLEEGLNGKSIGDELQVAVPPEKGYGTRDPEGVQKVPKASFPEGADIEPGTQFMATNAENDSIMVTVVEVEGEEVTIDGNHPLAGKTLHFEVKIEGVRDATDEEREHGHPHGPGGHEH